MYYLAADPTDVMFSHNLKILDGLMFSASQMRAHDPSLSGLVSHYEFAHKDRAKEAAFEDVRQSHFPGVPSRMGAIYLFNDLNTAKKANGKWWNNQRELYRAEILPGSNFHVADSTWLDCTPANFTVNAHEYFSGNVSSTPFLEVLVMGRIKVDPQPIP